jgi:hypothetical protein
MSVSLESLNSWDEKYKDRYYVGNTDNMRESAHVFVLSGYLPELRSAMGMKYLRPKSRRPADRHWNEHAYLLAEPGNPYTHHYALSFNSLADVAIFRLTVN